MLGQPHDMTRCPAIKIRMNRSAHSIRNCHIVSACLAEHLHLLHLCRELCFFKWLFLCCVLKWIGCESIAKIWLSAILV